MRETFPACMKYPEKKDMHERTLVHILFFRNSFQNRSKRSYFIHDLYHLLYPDVQHKITITDNHYQ